MQTSTLSQFKQLALKKNIMQQFKWPLLTVDLRPDISFLEESFRVEAEIASRASLIECYHVIALMLLIHCKITACAKPILSMNV